MKMWICRKCQEQIEDTSEAILKHQKATGHVAFDYREVKKKIGKQELLIDST